MLLKKSFHQESIIYFMPYFFFKFTVSFAPNDINKMLMILALTFITLHIVYTTV